MQTKIISNRTKTTRHRTKKLQVGNFVVVERYVDEKLSSQTWETNLAYTHQYERKHMHFAYYEDASFLDSDQVCNMQDFYDLIPEPTLITDWDNFDINNVLCIYLGMNGHIYRINQTTPVALWRRCDYIGGFDNSQYDLDKAAKLLAKKSWIRNVKIINVPYYNQYEGRTKAVEFDYKLPTRQVNQIKDMMELQEYKKGAQIFGVEKARINETV